MRLVAIESPYAGDIERNIKYLCAAMLDCFERGEAPFASHGLYTLPGVLDDWDRAQRDLGIRAGLEWAIKADTRVVYKDCGISPGMRAGIDAAKALSQPIEYRTIEGW